MNEEIKKLFCHNSRICKQCCKKIDYEGESIDIILCYREEKKLDDFRTYFVYKHKKLECYHRKCYKGVQK